MSSIAKQCFFFRRLWRGFTRRISTLYYRMVLGSLGARSVITPKVFIEHPYNVFIGADVAVNEYAILQGGPSAQIKIGDRVHISYGAMIFTANVSKRDGWYSLEHRYQSVVIEDDAIITSRAIIMPGVKIGARSIVAAGAVVTHDVEPDTVVAGIPAKPIRNLKSKNNL